MEILVLSEANDLLFNAKRSEDQSGAKIRAPALAERAYIIESGRMVCAVDLLAQARICEAYVGPAERES